MVFVDNREYDELYHNGFLQTKNSASTWQFLSPALLYAHCDYIQFSLSLAAISIYYQRRELYSFDISLFPFSFVHQTNSIQLVFIRLLHEIHVKQLAARLWEPAR